MKQELLNRLHLFYAKNPVLRGSPANLEQIANAEKKLNARMSDDYKEFILIFGGAYIGLDLHAFINGDALGKESVVELTDNARRLFNGKNLFPEINESIVVADDGSGNPIATDPEGRVVLFDYDTEEKQVLAQTLEDFIEINFAEW